MKTLRFKNARLDVKIVIIVFSLIFLLYAFICFYPVIFTFSNAIKTSGEYFDSVTALPKNPQFNNFIKVFSDFQIRGFNYIDMLINSLWILFVRVFVNVMSSVLLAYGISKFRFPGKDFIYAVVIFANTIPIIGSGAAGYKLLRDLNMINNPSTIWLSWAGGFDFAFIVFYGTFKGISNNYSEAAKIDGASNLRVMLSIVLPQAFPSIIAIAITQALTVWNSYSISMLYLRDYPTLAYGLYIFDSEKYYIENSGPIFFSAALISCIPVIVLYASNQKLLLTNITAGGLKG